MATFKISEIDDPKLRARILQTLNDADQLKHDIVKECPAPKKKRIRQDPKPLMNKLEEEYYEEYVKNEPNLCIQSIRFKLANGLWYKVDFFCPGGIPVGIEVKGPHAFRGGFENIKMAAHQYRWIKWILVWKDDKGLWQEQTVLP